MRLPYFKTISFNKFPISFFLYLFIFPLFLLAQETEEKNWTLQGYTKSMQGLFFIDIPGFSQQTLTDNFLHNRLNFNWFPSENWNL